MKYFLLLSLFTVQARADFWCPSTKEIRFPKPQGLECYDIPQGVDPESSKVINGVLVLDQVKVDAKEAKRLEREANQADKATKVAACEALYDNVNQANTLAEQKAILKCLVKDAR